MKILFDNKEMVESKDCYLHDSSILSLEYKPISRNLIINLETLLDEKTNKYKAIIEVKNIQYIEINNQLICSVNCNDEINGWELVELNNIKNYKQTNIFNEGKPFAVMFDFFCQAKLYVVATEIEFNRI